MFNFFSKSNNLWCTRSNAMILLIVLMAIPCLSAENIGECPLTLKELWNSLPEDSKTRKKLIAKNGEQVTEGLLTEFSQIVCLDISNCNLSTIPKGMELLPNLKKLNLAQNKIKTIDPDFEKLAPQLSHLILCQNELTELPDVLRMSVNLKKLDIRNNPFNNFPLEELIRFQKLKELWYTSDDLNYLKSLVRQLPNITDIIISSSSFVKIERIEAKSYPIQDRNGDTTGKALTITRDIVSLFRGGNFRLYLNGLDIPVYGKGETYGLVELKDVIKKKVFFGNNSKHNDSDTNDSGIGDSETSDSDPIAFFDIDTDCLEIANLEEFKIRNFTEPTTITVDEIVPFLTYLEFTNLSMDGTKIDKTTAMNYVKRVCNSDDQSESLVDKMQEQVPQLLRDMLSKLKTKKRGKLSDPWFKEIFVTLTAISNGQVEEFEQLHQLHQNIMRLDKETGKLHLRDCIEGAIALLKKSAFDTIIEDNGAEFKYSSTAIIEASKKLGISGTSLDQNEMKNEMKKKVKKKRKKKVKNQVRNQVKNQVRNQVRNQVGNQVGNQLKMNRGIDRQKEKAAKNAIIRLFKAKVTPSFIIERVTEVFNRNRELINKRNKYNVELSRPITENEMKRLLISMKILKMKNKKRPVQSSSVNKLNENEKQKQPVQLCLHNIVNENPLLAVD